jgi:hypothetical protein
LKRALWHRVFWALALSFQLGVLLATWIPTPGLPPPPLRWLAGLFLAIGCLPLAFLVAQKAVYRHNFWAGLFGVSVVNLAVAILGLGAMLLVAGRGVDEPAQVSIVLALCAQALGLFGQFVYVFADRPVIGAAGET